MPQPAAPEDFVKLFTDGACSGNPGPGGWAFILEHPATGRRMEKSGAEPHSTNNRMEIMSALRGLAILKRPCRVELVTDSLYLAKGISEWLPGWKANNFQRKEGRKLKPLSNEDLWREMDAQLAIHEIKVVHVRGHRGHPENERCDELAVNAYKQLMAGQLSPAPRPAATPVRPEPITAPHTAEPPPPEPRFAPKLVEPTISPVARLPERPPEISQATPQTLPITKPEVVEIQEPVEPQAPEPVAKKPARTTRAARPKSTAKSKSESPDSAEPKTAPKRSSKISSSAKATETPASSPPRKPAPKRARKAAPVDEFMEEEMPLRWDPDDM